MRVIAVDDEKYALDAIEQKLCKIPEISDIQLFDDPEKALKYTGENHVDVAFIDIEMYGMTGLELAKRFKGISPATNIVFVTGYAEYAVDAFSLAASGYLLKPANEAEIKAALLQLRNPVNPKTAFPLYVQCFGSFEVFANGKPVEFARSKSKEALAYLVDRKGASVTKKELAAVLLEDAPYSRSTQSYMHNIISEMTNTLKKTDVPNFIINKRGTYAVDISKFACDYYDYEKGIVSAINSYQYEYMMNYSWAEYKSGELIS